MDFSIVNTSVDIQGYGLAVTKFFWCEDPAIFKLFKEFFPIAFTLIACYCAEA